MNVKHICFDLDGVLINSLGVMEKSWIGCCKELDIKIEFSEYKKHIGVPFYDILNVLKIEKELWENLKEIYDNISTNSIEEIIKFEGIDLMFNKLESNNISYSIFTSKTRKRTTEIINKFFKNRFFEEVVCPEDLGVNKGKPSGAGLDQIIKNNSLIKTEFIYIGDTEFDIQCAQNANVDFLFANWGYGSTTKDIKKIDNVEEFTNLIIRNL